MHNGVWIEITRSWIDAAVVRRADVLHCHRHWRADESTPNHSLESDIADALKAITPKPGRVRILWSAPGVPVDLCPLPVPGHSGLRAVRLAHAAATGLIPDTDAIDAIPMPTRANPAKETATPLALAFGMSAALFSEIEAAVRHAGGTVADIYAPQATALVDTAASALAASNDRLSVSVSIGEDASAIAIAAGGRIALARTVDLGAAALRHSYEHVLREAGRFDSEAVAQPVRSIAEELFQSFGVPDRTTEMPHGVSADVVFQMMRPALQRLVFEVKQSIRFTSLDAVEPEEGRDLRATIRLIGSPIPNLAALIAHECDAIDASDAMVANSGPGSGIRAALGHHSPLSVLHIPTNRAAKHRMRVRMAACVGLAGAIGLVGADTWTARARALRLEHEHAELQTRLSLIGTTDERDLRIWEAADRATTAMTRQLAPVAPWAGCMAAIARELGPGVTLTKVTGDRDAARSFLKFDGEVAADTPALARDILLQALTRLRSSPLLVEVDVPSINQESRADGALIAFSLVATLREAPPTWLTEVAE